MCYVCVGFQSVSGAYNLHRRSNWRRERSSRRWWGRGGWHVWNRVQTVQAHLLYDKDGCGCSVWVSVYTHIQCIERKMLSSGDAFWLTHTQQVRESVWGNYGNARSNMYLKTFRKDYVLLKYLMPIHQITLWPWFIFVFSLGQWVFSHAGQVLCGRNPVDPPLLLPWGSILELVRTFSFVCLFPICFLSLQWPGQVDLLLNLRLSRKLSFYRKQCSWGN